MPSDDRDLVAHKMSHSLFKFGDMNGSSFANSLSVYGLSVALWCGGAGIALDFSEPPQDNHRAHLVSANPGPASAAIRFAEMTRETAVFSLPAPSFGLITHFRIHAKYPRWKIRRVIYWARRGYSRPPN